jgi:hypothetical protein
LSAAELEQHFAQMQTKKPAVESEDGDEERIGLGAVGALDTDLYGQKDRFAGYRSVKDMS